MWHKKYDACRDCKSDQRKHMAKGLCNLCYLRRYRNTPARRRKLAKQKRDWYYQNHQAQLRQKKQYRELRHYDGKRGQVLDRDDHRCVRCGSRKKLVVHHKDRCGRGNALPNNSLENLEVLCRTCHLAEHYTELLRVRHANRVPQLNQHGKWSSRHPACVACQTTKSKHAAKGLCGGCYQRSRREHTR